MRQLQFFATLLLMNASVQFANADECVVAIDAGDALSYSKKSITIPSSCASATINFTHNGSLPAAVMGHNWVLAKTADLQGIQNDGNVAGMSGGYLKDGDSRILAATNIIGGGESASITFPTKSLEAGGDYSFFCTVMSHSVVMKGSFTISG
jgi:azurin